MREMTYAQAIREALAEEMRRDKNVFLMGEDIAIFEGAFGVTGNLWKEFGLERVRDTPISEAAIVGAGVGAAIMGKRPVVEIMFGDFLPVGMDQIVNGILEAGRNLQPIRMGWSKTPIRGIAHSRRWKMKNGEVFTTRYGVPSTWRVDPDLIDQQGEIDPELTVIRFEDLSGKVLAVVSNFGVHPSVALASALASGDISGEAMHILENALGGDAIAFCTTGAAADVDPTKEMPYWGPRNEQNVLHIGRLLAAQILEALERTPVQDRHGIECLSLSERISLRQDWLQLMRVEQDKMKSEFPEAGETSRWIARAVENGFCEIEIQAVRLGDLIWVAFPGEVFVRTALQIKQASHVPLMVLETTNDYVGYIPPQQEFDEGGYECSQHFSSRLYPQAEEAVRRMALEAISGLNQQQASPMITKPGFCAEIPYRYRN